MMKATLKMMRPFSRPPSKGVMASRIDTAPRRPTQEMKAISGRGSRNGIRQSQTAIGRATKIRNRPSRVAGTRIAGNCEGVANRPRIRNMMI
jgi:hypothetical protein